MRLWRTSSEELDRLLQQRIANIRRDRRNAIAWTAVSFLLSTLLAAWVIRSITQSLAQVVQNLFSHAVRMADASETLAATAEDLRAQSTKQSESIASTASSNQEIESMTAANTKLSIESSSRIAALTSQITVANDALGHLTNAMEIISQSSSRSEPLRVGWYPEETEI